MQAMHLIGIFIHLQPGQFAQQELPKLLLLIFHFAVFLAGQIFVYILRKLKPTL
jgi:hypothetical protein